MEDQPSAAAPGSAPSRAPRACRPESAPGRRSPVAAILCAAAAWAVYVHFATAVVPFDDAYISYRYAENLAAGRGLVYNAGERVFGSSTPLYVLWLTALRLLLPGDLAAAAVRTNAIGFVAAALLAGWLVRRLTDRPLVGAATALALLVNPMLLTALDRRHGVVLVPVAGARRDAGARERSAAPRTLRCSRGLAILTRAEGVLLGPIGATGLRAAPARPAARRPPPPRSRSAPGRSSRLCTTARRSRSRWWRRRRRSICCREGSRSSRSSATSTTG